MRILLITPTFYPDVGGVETMVSQFCDYLTKRKFHVNVITYNPLIVKAKAPIKEKYNEYVTVWRIPWIGRGLFNVFEHYPPIQFFYLVPALTFTTIVYLLISKGKPDIIHAFGLSGACAGGLASRIFRIPSVVDMCTVYRLPKRPVLAWFVRRILSWSDYIRGNNTPGKEELLKIGINPNKVGIITPHVDESIFKPMLQTGARKTLGLPPENFIALFVGRMIDSKSVDLAVSATYIIKNPNINFVFIGEGPCQQLVENAGINDKRIIYIGNVKHCDLSYYYNAADILMCAQLDYGIVSYVGREALMCGLPILALKVSTYFNMPYIVDDNPLPCKIGRLIDSTPEALAICLNELIYKKEKEGILPFDRRACSEFGIANYSRRVIDCLGDAYEKTKKIRFSNKIFKK